MMPDFSTAAISASLTSAIIHFVWQGALLGAVAMLVQSAGKLRATHRYAAGLTMLCLMLFSFVATFCFTLATYANNAAAVDSPVVTRATVLSNDLVPDDVSSPVAMSIESIKPNVALIKESAGWSISAAAVQAQPVILSCYVAGVALLSMWLCWSYAATLWIRRGFVPLPQAWSHRIVALRMRLGVSSAIVIGLSDKVSDALVVGCWRPLILLPACWLTDLPVTAIEAVIAHELAHVRRFDLWINLFQRLVEIVLFFHPAVWWVSKFVRQEREKCCDENAVAATGEPLQYATTLELLARLRLARVRPGLAAAFRGGESMPLLERVRNVLGVSAGQQIGGAVGALVLALAGLAVMGSMSVYAFADGERREGDREVQRDGDREREGVREEPRRDGDREREGVRRDGEGDREREGDRPRDGDREREGFQRDGDREREADRLHDGDRPREGDVRRDGDRPRNGDRPREGDRPRLSDRPAGEQPRFSPREAQMMEMIMQMRREIEMLRREIRGMRGEREGDEERFSRERELREQELRRDREEQERKEVFRKSVEIYEREKAAIRQTEELQNRARELENHAREIQNRAREIEAREIRERENAEREARENAERRERERE